MSAITLSDRDRRALRVGALVLLPALFFVWGVRPYLSSLSGTREQLEIERQALVRERAAVATASRNPALKLAADSAMTVTMPRLFEANDDVIASSELAAYVASVARDSRVRLADASTRPTVVSDSGIRTVRVELRAESDLEGVMTFLGALESGQKLVRIDRLDLSPAPGSDDESFQVLTMTATVSGFGFVDPRRPATPAAGGRR